MDFENSLQQNVLLGRANAIQPKNFLCRKVILNALGMLLQLIEAVLWRKLL